MKRRHAKRSDRLLPTQRKHNEDQFQARVNTPKRKGARR